MNYSRDSKTEVNSSWECIDPAMGNCLWELEVDETTEERSQQLQAHLQLCDACRLDQALNTRLEQGLQAGALVLPPAPKRIWWQRSSVQASAGSALIAACLALLMLLPPAPSGDFVHLRGAHDDPHFIRPVEGEMVIAENTLLTWQPVDGATSYRITLSDVASDFNWVGTTSNTQIQLPPLNEDPQTLRAVLATVPADLVAPGRISVCFNTGNWAQMVQDRMLKAPLWMLLFIVSGVLLLGLSLFSRQRLSPTT